MEIENVNSNISNAMDEEAHIEQLLSEKLMDGYVLMEKSCPVCATPLVKNHIDDEEEDPVAKEVKPVMVPTGSFSEPFKPVQGVPYCVGCSSHVITQECEISILEKCDSLKAEGGILVAMSATTASTSESGTPSAMNELTPVKEEPEVIDVTKMEEPVEHEHKHLEEKKEEVADETMIEYSVRREIATKVLGAKMLQGYSLMEKQCGKCGMPMMEYKGDVNCVVCPALIKKAKKKMKAQQKLAEESVRLGQEIEAVKAKQAEEEKKAIVAAVLEERNFHDVALSHQKLRMEQEEMERELRLREKMNAERARRLAIVDSEKRRVAALEAEQARLLVDAQTEVEREGRMKEEQKHLNSIKAEEEEAQKQEIRKVKAGFIEQEYAAKTERRILQEQKISEETKRLEDMEHRRKMGLTNAFENMNRDVLVAEHRKRLEEKAKLDTEIARLEEYRIVEKLEFKKVADEKRVEEETRMIATLEEEAAFKATVAEEAIRKAKAALEHVHSARREVIAQTIAYAEQEAVQEAESFIKKEREDYKAPVILATSSDIQRENWETLRTEGRSVMTRRVMAGWILLAEFCEGDECYSSPLINKDGRKECVVCGGCGDGNDGVYNTIEDYDVVPTDDELQEMRVAGVVPDLETTGYEITPHAPRPISPTAAHTVEQIQEDFETKRNMVSKEIGKRMIDGWTLLDASCPQCVMPLMMDTEGTADICVLCGLVSNIQNNDGSTIKNTEVEVPRPPQSVAIVTQPAPTDAGTMASTIPTIEPTVNQLPAAPTFEKKDEPSDELADSIRQNVQRNQPSITPRSDPPASMKSVSKGSGVDPVSVKIAKSMSVEEIIQLVTSKSSEKPVNESFEVEAEEFTRYSPSVEIFTGLSAMSAIAISDSILKSPTGAEAQQMGSLSPEKIADLVDIYVATNFSETVSDEVKDEVVKDIQRKLHKLSALQDDGVIHLEELPSPQNFKFDMIIEETGAYQEEEAQTVATSTSKKEKPTPETMSRARNTSLPPRPDSGPSAGRASRLNSPPHRLSPRKGSMVIVGGPSDFAADSKSFGDMSRAESVATDALDGILDRIEAAKATLLRDNASIEDQLAAANLIEKLAQAAVAVKALEKIGC